MSEELLNLLARVPGLKVAARTSAFAYKGRNVDIRAGRHGARCRDRARGQRAAGRRPGAHHGAADRHRVRVSPVVRNLRPQARGHLRGAGRNRAGDRRQAAHPARARRSSNSRSAKRRRRRTSRRTSSTCRPARSGNGAARKTCAAPSTCTRRRSARIPPLRAPAPRWRRRTSCCPATPRKRTTRKNTCRSRKQSARQALSLDPKIGEAHAVLAQINSDRGNLLDAESGFFFAISLEPNEPTPHHWYSILLQKVGRLDAALDAGAARLRARPQLADHRRRTSPARTCCAATTSRRCAIRSSPRNWA